MEINTSNPSVTISTDPPLYPASDFRLLRSEGIQWIQQLAGTSWTDYNTHDPGITILDLLCYAITDLSNRLDYDIKDLLATENGNNYESLYSPAQVLTCNPVTLSDFRKVLLDVEDVKNAWIDKQTGPGLFYFPEENIFRLLDNENKGQPIVIKGIYNVMVELTLGGTGNVISRLQNSRNLCEDYNKIVAPVYQSIAVSGIVEIGQTEDVNKTVLNILKRIADFIAPAPGFYTLAEMLAKGKTIDEIFQGPALMHGFLDDEELDNIRIRTELYTSDIIREMMDEPGVLRVSNIRIYDSSSPTSAQNWVLPLDTARIPSLDVNTTIGTTATSNNADGQLIFKKNGVTLTIDKAKIQSSSNSLTNTLINPLLPIESRDIVPQQGDYYTLDEYYSIQNQFPQVFGIGETGLPKTASALRQAQANQLKAYLLFFEQILADYCAQAAHIKDLFSFQNTSARTYFQQSLRHIVPGADEIFIGSNDEPAANYETYDKALGRKNRLLDHQVARFGESLSEYSLHEQSYEQWKPPANNTGYNPANVANVAALEKLVSDKLRFLANYPLISNNRGKAFNYTQESWNTTNISGLKKRIAAKLGIVNDSSYNLAGGEEGFHLLEHILLRPLPEDSSSVTKPIDSFEDGGAGYTICNSPAHGLLNNEQILITGSKIYNNTIYKIEWLSADRFKIATVYKGAEENTGQWATVTNYLIFSDTDKPITAFTKDVNNQSVICTSPGHNLAAGINIEINGTGLLDGVYKVQEIVDDDSFKINFLSAEEKTYEGITGSWVRIMQPDFYSLQLTCMFPDDAGRFADPGFRSFVENTVREETPVHLTVYIRWLAPGQMLQFERAFSSFLNALQIQQPDNNLRWRASRNSLVDMLPLGVNSYPLADIPVIMPGGATELIVQYNEPAVITLPYSQPDVVYRILDQETGNQQMNESSVDEDNKGNDDGLSLKTIPLTRDNYLFSIEAFNPATQLRTRLFQTVSVRIGINTGLKAIPKESEIAYGTQAIIIVKDAQSGTNYQLFTADKKTGLSDAIGSVDGGDLEISTKEPLQEDTGFTIKATNIHTNESAFLDDPGADGPPHEIKVYPNTNLPVEYPAIADYNKTSTINLNNTQKSAWYYLSFNDIDDDDNTTGKSGRKDQMIGKEVSGNNSKAITLPADNLTEDLTVNIIAKKKESGLEKPLPNSITFQVRPDPDKTLTIIKKTTLAGDSYTIKVSNTQPGVLYQLRKVIGDGSYENIGNPVFHHRNHGIGTAKIETDFVIDYFTATDVFLPAGMLTETTVFNVLATKATTKLTADVGNITVEINP